MPWSNSTKTKFDDDDVMQEDIAKIIKQVDLKQQNETEKLDVYRVEKTIDAIRDELTKEFTNYNPFLGCQENVMDTTILNIRQAYIHYCKLLASHITMVKKDVLTDVASLHDISNKTLLLYTIYGEAAFKILFVNENIDKLETEDECLNCGS